MIRVIIKDVRKNTVKNDTPLFIFVHIGTYLLPSCGRPQTWLNTQWSDSWTSSNYHMSVSDCCWHWQDTVLAAGCQQVLSVCLSVYLSIAYISNASADKLRGAIYSALSLFLSLSTIHCYMLWTSTLAKNQSPPCPPLSTLGHTPLPLRADVLYGWPLTGRNTGMLTTSDRAQVFQARRTTADSHSSWRQHWQLQTYTRIYRLDVKTHTMSTFTCAENRCSIVGQGAKLQKILRFVIRLS